MSDKLSSSEGTSTLPKFSCALAPSARIPGYAKVAEDLGYERLWVYDSPALYGDVWIAIALAANATSRIGLGTGVAVPSLRHPMVTASAIAAVEELAPGRLVVALGTGFTARLAMGQKPMRWDDLRTYVLQLRALLHGDVVDVDGGLCQMIHSPGFGPPRPINVPILTGPIGPKGFAVSREVADGVLLTEATAEGFDERWSIRALLMGGTVVAPGEDHATPRVREALGPMVATSYHAAWSFAPDLVKSMPGGEEWLNRLNGERPEEERHLAVHEGHLVVVSERDQPLVAVAGPEILRSGWTGSAEEIRHRMEEAGAAGITEVMFMAAGPDIERELEAFAVAAQGG